MWPISHVGVGGLAQHRRSLIYMVASFLYVYSA